MFNRLYRNAIGDRPRQFRKFGRAAWVKRSSMSRPRKPKTSKFIADGNSSYLRAQIGKRSRESYPMVSRKRMRWDDRAEEWLRQHPSTVKFVTGTVDYVWDHGVRDIVRGHLYMRLRGKRKGREEL